MPGELLGITINKLLNEFRGTRKRPYRKNLEKSHTITKSHKNSQSHINILKSSQKFPKSQKSHKILKKQTKYKNLRNKIKKITKVTNVTKVTKISKKVTIFSKVKKVTKSLKSRNLDPPLRGWIGRLKPAKKKCKSQYKYLSLYK